MCISSKVKNITRMLAQFASICVLLTWAPAIASTDFFDIERDLSISHSKVKPFYGCETTAFPPNKSSLVPTYTIDLALQPRQRWTELVLANKETLVEMVGHVYNLTEAVLGESAVRFLLDNLGKIIDSIPHVYREELTGIAEASGLELEQVTFYNIFYEIFSFCTSIVVQDSSGELYHGRNLDFGLFLGWNNATHEWRVAELLKPLVAQLEWRNSTSVVYTSVTFAGYIGVVTANKPGVFSFSVNERFSWNGGYVGLLEWVLFGDHNQSWLALLTRDVLLDAVSYDDAVKRFSSPRLIAPVYFTLAGTQPGQGCIITRYRDSFEILELGSQDYLSTWYLVQTNYDHWKSPPFFDDRRTPAVTCLDNGSSVPPALSGQLQPNSAHRTILEADGLSNHKSVTEVPDGVLAKRGTKDAKLGADLDSSATSTDEEEGKMSVVEYVKQGAREIESVLSKYWRAGLLQLRHLMGHRHSTSPGNSKNASTKTATKFIMPEDKMKTNLAENKGRVVASGLENEYRTKVRSGVKTSGGNVTKPLELLYNVLSTRPVLNKLTTYTTLMSAKKGYIKSWIRYCPDPCWPW